MKNKNILLRAEVAEKSEGIEPLTQAHQLTLWDNLLYQTVTEKSSAIRDAILQMLVADNFLRKNDIESSGELIKNDKDLRRLAKAYVVIPKNVPNNAPTLTAISQKPREKDFTRLKKQLDVFEAKIELEDYTNGLKEVDEAVKNLENENREDFNTVYEEYLEAVQAAYEKATEIIDPETGDVTYEGLELPEFSFTPKNIFDEGYLEERLSPKSLNIVQKAKDEGADNENSLKGYLEKRQSKDNRVIIENKKKQTKTVFYKRNIIQVEEPVAPLTSFIADAQYSHSDASKFYLNLLISYPDTEVDVENNDLTVRFDDEGTAEGFELKVVERTDNSILLSSYPEELNPQDAGKNLQISGSIHLDNEDTLDIGTRQMSIGAKPAIGRLDSSLLASRIEPKLEHYGIEKVGVVDFRRVEQEVCCYVPGDVSRIENILAKEYRERSTRQLLSTETTTEHTTETEIEKLSDTTTSERNELASEISSVINQDRSKDYGASASVKGKFGNIEFETKGFINGASSTSTSNSNSTSETYAKEITTQALERITQKVSERRTSRILREFEENNKHGFDNRSGETHVTGIYRWVDKIYKNRLINYGKRLVYEFSIPEPSRFFKKAIIQILEGTQQHVGNPEGLIFPDEPVPPEEFGIASATHIGVGNYQVLAAQYGAQVNAPLPISVNVGTSFTKSQSQGDGDRLTNKAIEKEIQLPEGYRYSYATVTTETVFNSNDGHYIAVSVGGSSHRIDGNKSSTFILMETGSHYSDKVPVSVSVNKSWIANVNVTIKCYRTDEALQQWQNETFDAIWEAYRNRVLEYEAKVREYNDMLYANYIPPTPDDEETSMEFNPLLNRALEKRELKRLAVQMLAKPFDIKTARNSYAYNSATTLNLNAFSDKHAAYAKFFEQAFDWEVMAYTFYPYFYADEDDWEALFQQSNGTDPVFQAFLQSGLARMEVPVRPGFEDLVNYFMETGSIWMGNQLAVERDDDLYLSVADELQQPEEGVVENEWETRFPTDLTILQANAAPLDETGLPCCHNENEEDNLAYGHSVMHGKDEDIEP